MTTTYTMHIDSLECKANSEHAELHENDCDILTSVMWTYTANDGVNTASLAIRTPLYVDIAQDEVESNNEPFLTMSEANVISMIQSTIGNNQILAYQSQLDTNLLSANSITHALPWH